MRTYQNPVYHGYLADPFAWKVGENYFAVGTGPVIPLERASEKDLTSWNIGGEERAFPILFSKNFSDWKLLGGALRVPESLRGGAFWAPEVAYDGHQFYLYYSVSMEGLNHRLRVARSSQPEGPYEDLGLLMPRVDQCPFAIDPHAFRDDDGQWYLFYARDFLDTAHGFRAGTGLVIDRLLDMTRLAGEEKIVLRARSNWQLFKSNRPMYGGIYDWHTLEGPCVRKREGQYYCFYSGGCYENDSYGVDYGIAEHVLGPYSDAGNETGPRVMKTISGQVIGPGHTSIVRGPDHGAEFFAYHAWSHDMSARQFYLDELRWTGEGPRCSPTRTPQEVLSGSRVY
jgi:beta-xylosidase